MSAPVKGHLDQVDLFRVLTFAAVVGVHTTNAANPATSVGADGVAHLLHFTREAFFFLTGFVLVHSQGSRPLDLKAFWRKRFRLIGIPYLTWTLIYATYTLIRSGGSLAAFPGTLAFDAATGRGFYHLYFLLVSMQAYLLFPLLLGLLRATRQHPWLLLLGAGALELAQTLYLHYGTPPASGPLHWYVDWAYALFPAYILYLVAGALVARHLGEAQAWLLAHRPAAVALGLGGLTVAEGWYLLAVRGGAAPDDGTHDASAVLQPVLILWSLGAIALLAVVSVSWAARPAADRDPRFRRALVWASSASFGVYLVHPLVLAGVLELGVGGPQPLATIAAWALTLLGAGVLVEGFRRTPASLALTGRARPSRRKPPVPAVAPAPGVDHVPAAV